MLIVSMMLLVLASCSYSAMLREEEAGMLFSECARKAFGNGQWLSMEVDEYRFYDTLFLSHSNHISYFNGENFPVFYIGEHSTRQFKLKDDSLFLVNNQDNEIGSFAQHEECNGVYDTYKWTIESKLGYVPNYYTSAFLLLKPTEQVEIEDWTDTVVDGVPYYLFRGLSSVKYISEGEADIFNIPIQYHCKFWVNKETYQLDSLYACKNDTAHLPYLNELAYAVKNVNHEDKSFYYDSVFNFTDSLYEKHSRHNDRFIPYSMGGRVPNLETNSLFDYPLVSLGNDTITIANREGWILLNLWSFNCPSCIKNLQKYGREMDSL